MSARAVSRILAGQAAGRGTMQDHGRCQNLIPHLPSRFSVGLRIFHAESSSLPGPLFLSWPTRKRPLGLQGPKIALVFMSQPPGTADMRRMEPASTCHRPDGGWPLRVRPSFCQEASGQPLQILGAGEVVMLGEDVLFWLCFNSSPLLNWKQLCSPDQPPKNC